MYFILIKIIKKLKAGTIFEVLNEFFKLKYDKKIQIFCCYILIVWPEDPLASVSRGNNNKDESKTSHTFRNI